MIGIFLLYIISTTLYQIHTLNKLYESKKELTFYKLYFLSQKLLVAIFENYNKHIEELKEKAKFVIDNYDKNLNFLKNRVGKNHHIFITDKDFIIRKTTFKYDKNFSLAFAKDLFYKYKNKITVSLPICEPATTNFFTYAYTMLNNHKVIQVGYIINSSKIELIKKQLKKLKEKNPFIKDITLFFIHPQTKYAQECKILTPLYRKYTLKEMIKTRKFGINLYKKLLKQNPLITKDAMYILGINPIDNKGYIIFELKLNKNLLKNEINKTIFISISITVIFIIILLIIYINIHQILNYLKEFTLHIKNEKIFDKKTKDELQKTIDAYNNTLKKLKESIKNKEDFIYLAMHELATPITILSLYADEYKELKGPIKKLMTTYKNLSFATKPQTKAKRYHIIELREVIKERIEFFKEIIENENIEILLNLKNTLFIKANREDIEILIDNNIKNAIKYSIDKKVYITLEKNILTFENKGEIKNSKKLFDKFYREDNVKGGFGLGLYIIKNICKKYGIKIEIIQKNNKIQFKYIFKEHDEKNSNN